MRVSLGILMTALMVFGLVKAAYDRYWHDHPRNTSSDEPPDITTIGNPLQHRDWRVRVQAIRDLGAVSDAAAVDELLPMLNDDDYDVRTAASKTLAAIGQSAVSGLLATLQTGKQDARQAAAQALGQIGDASAVDSLVGALKDESKWVRLAAVQALGHIGASEAGDALALARDEDSDSQVREAAASALKQLR